MSQNSFIQQYLAKQQELLRQRLEREAQQDDADGKTVDINTNHTIQNVCTVWLPCSFSFSLVLAHI